MRIVSEDVKEGILSDRGEEKVGFEVDAASKRSQGEEGPNGEKFREGEVEEEKVKLTNLQQDKER